MRVAALSADGHLEVIEKPEPEPGPADVVIAVERCGICGSDLHLKDSGLLPVGAVMGHEFAGTVAVRGEEAPGHLPEGRRVAVLPARRCGACEHCQAGRSQLCLTQLRTAIGLGFNDGAFAEYVRVPAASCYPLPEDMSPEQGALVEPYAVGLHAVARSRASTSTSTTTRTKSDLAVGILGAGPIGLMCVAALRQAGVGRIALAEPEESRSEVGRAMGASVVSTAGQLARSLAGQPDLVFDAAGTPASLPLALESVKVGGQVVMVGAPSPGQVVPMPGLLWLMKEVDVVPAMAYTDEEFARAVEAVAGGVVDPRLLVSEVRPLEAADRSFAELSQPGRPVKVVLAPHS